MKKDEETPSRGQRLVSATAERMRDLILARAPGEQIGALPELAKLLDVGTATIQQVARVLEHEGLLEVRRGPGGGYFGARPDAAALERSVAAYLRVRGSNDYEALEMMTLVDCELMPAAAAAASGEETHRNDLRALEARIDSCVETEQRLAFEDEMHGILFNMVDQPLMELLARVSMRYYRSQPIKPIFEGDEGLQAWRKWRRDIIGAILKCDPDLARFEASRHRRDLLARLGRAQPGS